jgi:hypothetical protein
LQFISAHAWKKRKTNEMNAMYPHARTYPRASTQLLYHYINGRLVYTLTVKRLYDLSFSKKKIEKTLVVYTYASMIVERGAVGRGLTGL